MTEQVRVRYAPSPTGHLHIGNTRTALFNYLFARHAGGKFIIRIEDTDLKRNVAGGEESQLKYLKWLGIEWDESVDVGGEYGPYRQTERLDIYRKHYEELLERGLAYPCYCTEEELEQEREAQKEKGETPRYSGKCRHLTEAERAALAAEGRVPSIRFQVPEDRTYSFDDMVKGTISFSTEEIGDFVIVKKDGIPTYNYAVAVDDHLMKISHVLRGEEHISNTPRQLMIYEAYSWEPPVFGHMTLIVGENRKKLSKRDESIVQFIAQYDKLGYLPETMMNFIALLGWSPEGENEIFTKEELIAAFNADRLSQSPAMFDTQKLAWMNGQYIKNADPERVVRLCLPILQEAGRLPESLDAEKQAWAERLIRLFQDKLSCGADIVELTTLFFEEDVHRDEEAAAVLEGEHVPVVLGGMLDELKAAESDELAPEAIKAMLKSVQKGTGFKGMQLFMPIRVAVTGQMHGPDLNETISLLGRQKTMARLAALLP
ncbi:glutamate--tRNA ligase [Gorillibacterium sp. CAU 1737]|uniref:glutamate--tRNA ligase n=1 Tax=Gorillibacterium sp. CAU 1737 TaxID=3140362 RepID=UPI003261BC0C